MENVENKFIFLLKTYHNDFIYIGRLLESFHRYNKDRIPLYIIVSCGEKEEFQDKYSDLLKSNISLLEEDKICSNLTKKGYAGMSAGYLNQEIVKLSFWENKYALNYCCIDSETIFIRNFYYEDFMYNETEPYTVLIEDHDLCSDPVYYKAFWKEREKQLQKIQNALDYHPHKLLTCHGYQIMSSVVLKDLKERYLKPKGLTYLDLLKIAPLEFSWYNLWLQKEKIIPIHYCEPVFKTFHMIHQYSNAWMIGIQESDWARGYVGYILQSNFFPNRKVTSYEDAEEIPFLIPSHRLSYGIRSILYSCLIQGKHKMGQLVRRIMEGKE